MNLDILPTRTAGAAENMANDFLLLQRYAPAELPRFRHYGWRAPAFTFGYAQKIDLVRAQLPPGETFDLCRRPTGGGIVDHRDDWTYSLVIPRGHPLEDARATQSYRVVHEALAAALGAQGTAAALKLAADETDNATPGVCFQRAEIYDVIDPRTQAKIAGAAQKRNKRGLLFQGSIARQIAGPGIDWDRFEAEFARRLGTALAANARPVPWPEFNEDEVSGLTEQYSSPDWLEHR